MMHCQHNDERSFQLPIPLHRLSTWLLSWDLPIPDDLLVCCYNGAENWLLQYFLVFTVLLVRKGWIPLAPVERFISFSRSHLLTLLGVARHVSPYDILTEHISNAGIVPLSLKHADCSRSGTWLHKEKLYFWKWVQTTSCWYSHEPILSSLRVCLHKACESAKSKEYRVEISVVQKLEAQSRVSSCQGKR